MTPDRLVRSPRRLAPARRTAFGLTTLGCLLACSPPQAPPPAPPLVTVASPVQRDVVAAQVFVGTTAASETAEIRARVPGFLDSIAFEPGSIVEAGDLLFTIEKDEYAARRDQAAASVALNQAELARTEADLQRAEKAVQTNAISVSEVGLRRADRDKAQANLAAAQAALREAELKLAYTEVRSPIAGRVDRNLVDVGNLVGSNENTLLTTVRRVDPIHVYFEIPERLFLRFLREAGGKTPSRAERKERYPVFIAVEDEEGFPHPGWVDFAENTVNPETGTIQIRVQVENPDMQLFPGLFARSQVPGEELPGAVLVPEDSIGTDLAGKFLLIVGADGMVERRSVALGPADGGERVILEGLEGDEEVIVDGLVRARPGLPVRTQTAAQAAAGGTPAFSASAAGGRQ